MASSTAPFAGFEWAIAWRYLRARRSEGGISVMSVISLVGIALAVFALIATLAVRTGFRIEFVGTILGANAHASVYSHFYEDEYGVSSRLIRDYDEWAERLREVPGVTRAAPVIKAQILATGNGRNAGVEVYGERFEDLQTLPLVANPLSQQGDIANYENGVAIGNRLAAELGLIVGDYIRLISPEGVALPFGGTQPRINDYEIVYVFEVGRYDIDRTRVYMPFAEAQSFFNAEGGADEIEVMVEDPEAVSRIIPNIFAAIDSERAGIWTWQDSSRGFLNALQMEDNIMFVILSILVLIATMNIVSGLIMLVKNKGRDIGILRTIGLTEGSILRVFFICGASIGVIGTLIGVICGCLFAIYIDPIFNFINGLLGGGAWSPEKFGLPTLPAKLVWQDVAKAMSLSLGLSFIITIFPARRAARMNPVEALRYE